MKNISIALTIILLSILSGCNDFLEREPVSVAVDEKFWTTKSEAESGVNGGYSLLRESLLNIMAYFAYGDLPTEEFASVGGYDYDPVRFYNLELSVPVAETWRPMRHYRDWTNFFRVIDQSNRVIARISSMSDESFTTVTEKNHLIGEGYFLRAFTYFYMSRIWGSVPLILEPYNDPLTASFFVPRSSETDVHAQITADIAMAIELLTTEVRGLKGSRATKATAYALQAHFAAWRGEYQGTIDALDAFEAQGDYSYDSATQTGYLNRFYKGTSQDNVFFIPRLLDNNESSSAWGGAIDGDIGNVTGVWIEGDVRHHIDLRSEPVWSVNASNLSNLYEAKDARLLFGFKYVGTSSATIIKYCNFNLGSESWRARYSYVLNIFRYTELRLLKAEAHAALGNSQAEDILNEVRNSRGLNPWTGTGDIYEEVMDERARELYLEGHRFYDLVRMAKYKGVFKFENMSQPDFSAGKYYWPVDPILFTNNPALKQTEFWSSLL
ncbi:RagB/SusD family nutrient uptake outer membrane protein [Ohtaekwangia koreensis]|uniref:SusD family protein n=1 Tax=Ohtaekwangia koreensis TaxID=688867 RepID=A0A1T5MDV1_9BACT|nr:RagB/SusD family nutrient uptake outer membrane protein [Ohtaekwangia koreensis]SKC86059.1 SusD family protein [Ohtaekwangia koreensis]